MKSSQSRQFDRSSSRVERAANELAKLYCHRMVRPSVPRGRGEQQSRDLEAKAALVHIDVSPDSLDQFSLVDDFARVFGKDDENVKRTATNVKSSSILLQ